MENLRDFHNKSGEKSDLRSFVPNWSEAITCGLINNHKVWEQILQDIPGWEKHFPDLKVIFQAGEDGAPTIFQVFWKERWWWVYQGKDGMEIRRVERQTRAEAFDSVSHMGLRAGRVALREEGIVKALIMGPTCQKVWGEFSLDDLVIKSAPQPEAA